MCFLPQWRVSETGTAFFNMSRKNSGYLLVFSAGILWGTIGLFVKQMELGGSSPVETAFLRVFFAFLILLVICICRGGWRSLRADRRTVFICALLGIVCHGIYNIFYSFAVTMAGVSISAVLLNIAPIFTLLCSCIFFQERFTSRKFIAIVINIIGCILTVTNGHLVISASARRSSHRPSRSSSGNWSISHSDHRRYLRNTAACTHAGSPSSCNRRS